MDVVSQKIQRTFAHYPDADVLYQTFDGQLFFRADHAANHANSLPVRTVDTIHRPATAPAPAKEEVLELPTAPQTVAETTPAPKVLTPKTPKPARPKAAPKSNSKTSSKK